MTIFFISSASAQQNNQIWLDYHLSYPFSNQYIFELTTSYQTLLGKEKNWRSLSLTPNFEYEFSNRINFLGTMPMLYTQQIDSLNTFEFNPTIGAKWHIAQNKRVDSRLTLKFEERYFKTIESNTWETSSRTRLKAEVWIAVNGPNLFTDKLYYVILEYEEFFVLDQQLHERFANQRRAKLGVGYRKNYRNRFELIYTLQSARDEIQGGFERKDNVLQLRYKYFLNPSRVAATP